MTVGSTLKRKAADKPLAAFKQRIRELTCRSGGRSMSEVVERLRSYMLGWKEYFQLAHTPKVWRKLDEWLRHRLRAIQLKHWKRGTTMYRELLKLGAAPSVTKRVAANSRCWWHNSDRLLKTVLTIRYFDRLGVPRLTSTARTARCGPACRVVWQGSGQLFTGRPYADPGGTGIRATRLSWRACDG